MTDSQPTHADPDPPAPRGRRAALTAGATAAMGAVGVVLARPAEAKAGSPLLLGRSNAGGSLTTLVSSTATSAAFSVKCTAGSALLGDTTTAAKWAVYGRNLANRAGPAGAVRGDGRNNVGVLGGTTNRNQYGIVALNTSTTAGNAGALMALGGANAGVVAFTDAPANAPAPAIYADGGAAAWAAWLLGDVQVDGMLVVGVQDSVNGIGYRDAVSGEDIVHTQSGRAALDSNGNATVPMSASFLDAADFANDETSVQLTAMGGAMPNLSAGVTATGFTISGGTAGGSVSWTVTAPRRPPGPTAAAVGAMAAAAAKASALISAKTMAARRNASRLKRTGG